MTTRTFKQFGIAYGEQPANITAKINNVVIYQGPVVTLNESFPELPNAAYTVTNELFSWNAEVAFSGNQVLEIAIDNNADLLVAFNQANYTPVEEVVGNVGNVTIVSSGPNGYIGFPSTQFGNTYINDVLQPPVEHGNLTGQWWWRLPADGTFVENITIVPGLE